MPMSHDDTPRVMNTEPKRADSDAKRMSHASAMANPPPTAAPLTAAITGWRSRWMRSCSDARCSWVSMDERDRVHPLGAGRAVLPLDALEVVAGAEAPAGAGEDHRPHVAIGVDALERRRAARRSAPGSGR